MNFKAVYIVILNVFLDIYILSTIIFKMCKGVSVTLKMVNALDKNTEDVGFEQHIYLFAYEFHKIFGIKSQSVSGDGCR